MQILSAKKKTIFLTFFNIMKKLWPVVAIQIINHAIPGLYLFYLLFREKSPK